MDRYIKIKNSLSGTFYLFIDKMENIVDLIRVCAVEILMTDYDTVFPTITFRTQNAILTLNAQRFNDELNVWGRYDSRTESYEYELVYDPDLVQSRIVEIDIDGWNEIDNLDFFEEFIPQINAYLMECTPVKWCNDYE